mmetsp:Transcript_33493/g.72505  ORF Transcript_33493/g.72505 Transcript_33493/m.72505 type:complete len:102 (+) Transcript_33493:8234-8539(+)
MGADIRLDFHLQLAVAPVDRQCIHPPLLRSIARTKRANRLDKRTKSAKAKGASTFGGSGSMVKLLSALYMANPVNNSIKNNRGANEQRNNPCCSLVCDLKE